MLKIWFDVLTPKQLLFFESMIERSKKEHKVLFTSRNYKEVNELAKIRGLDPIFVGNHGGGILSCKLDAALDRAKMLSGMVQKFQPDVTVSFCSPEASRISFGLGVPHVGFSNSPHAEAISRLSIPLLNKLLIPQHIPKILFAKYGLDMSNIIQYKSMDELLIVRNKSTSSWDGKSVGLQSGKKTIFFRTYETQAAYVRQHIDTNKILDSIIKEFSDCNIVVLGRYDEQIEELKRRYGNNAIILTGAVDSGSVLARCDLLVGSGGTMTTEAVLRGIPTISYEAVPNLDEEYLVMKKVLVRAKDPSEIIKTARYMLSLDKLSFQETARRLLEHMHDPYEVLVAQLNSIKIQ